MSDDFGLANFQRLTRQTVDSFRPAMAAAADVIEPQAETGAHDTIAGMSGATFASIIAYVADADDDGTAEIVSAYNAAAGRLQGFAGHDGEPFLSGVPGPGPSQTWIVLTVPTDYIAAILMERNDFLGDAAYQASPAAFQAFVARMRGAWKP